MTNKQIRDKIDSLLTSARKDHESVMTSLESYEERLEAATGEMNEAIASSDLEAYSVATARVSDAQRALDLYGKRKDALEASPLVAEDQVRSMRDDVMANYTDAQEKTVTRLKEIAAELDQLRTTLEAEAKTSNKLLHDLQYSVGRGIDLRYGKDGKLRWDSGEWTVTPLHGRHGNVIGLLRKLTPKDVEAVLG